MNRIIVVIILLIIVFLASFVPQYIKVKRLENDLLRCLPLVLAAKP
jgi:hypothetical protein